MRRELGKYIVADPEICHGQLTFRGTRILVANVLEQVADGMDWQAIIDSWRGRVRPRRDCRSGPDRVAGASEKEAAVRCLMIILDENMDDTHRRMRVRWRIRCRQIGLDVGRAGMSDADIVRWLHRLTRTTFFSFDEHFYRRDMVSFSVLPGALANSTSQDARLRPAIPQASGVLDVCAASRLSRTTVADRHPVLGHCSKARNANPVEQREMIVMTEDDPF